jgi:hypothetical protein
MKASMKRLAALTHLDATWRPRDIEQREGRILRHVTTGEFNAYMWQLLKVKARFIAQVMCSEVSTRCVEDLDNAALTFAEIKAIASGNPLVIYKVASTPRSANSTLFAPPIRTSYTGSVAK